jgi:hypothetical protein
VFNELPPLEFKNKGLNATANNNFVEDKKIKNKKIIKNIIKRK